MKNIKLFLSFLFLVNIQAINKIKVGPQINIYEKTTTQTDISYHSLRVNDQLKQSSSTNYKVQQPDLYIAQNIFKPVRMQGHLSQQKPSLNTVFHSQQRVTQNFNNRILTQQQVSQIQNNANILNTQNTLNTQNNLNAQNTLNNQNTLPNTTTTINQLQNCYFSNCLECHNYTQLNKQFYVTQTQLVYTSIDEGYKHQYCGKCADGYFLYRHPKVNQSLVKLQSDSQSKDNIASINRIMTFLFQQQQACIPVSQKIVQATIVISGINYDFYLQEPLKYKTWIAKTMKKYTVKEEQINVVFVRQGSLVMDFWFLVPKDFIPNGDVSADVFNQETVKEIDGSSVLKFQIQQIKDTEPIQSANNQTTVNSSSSSNSTSDQSTANNTTPPPEQNTIQPASSPEPNAPKSQQDYLPIIIAGVLSSLALLIAAIYMLCIRKYKSDEKQDSNPEQKEKKNEKHTNPQQQEQKRANRVGSKQVNNREQLKQKPLKQKEFYLKKKMITKSKNINDQHQKQQTSIIQNKNKNVIDQNQINNQQRQQMKQSSSDTKKISTIGLKQKSFIFFKKLINRNNKNQQIPKLRIDLDQIPSMEELAKSNLQSNKPIHQIQGFM